MENSNSPLKPKSSTWADKLKEVIGKPGSFANTPTKEETAKGWTPEEKQEFLKGYSKKP